MACEEYHLGKTGNLNFEIGKQDYERKTVGSRVGRKAGELIESRVLVVLRIHLIDHRF